MDCIAWMEANDTYFIEGTKEDICRDVVATSEEFDRSVAELDKTQSANVKKSQGFVKIVSRRLSKRHNLREYNRIKKQESRRQENVNEGAEKTLRIKIRKKEEEEISNNVDKLNTVERSHEPKTARDRLDPKTYLPSTFRPPPDFIEWAITECPNLVIEDELEEFITFWRESATKNNRRTIRGWNQAWKNHMRDRQAKAQGAKGNGVSQGQRKTNLERIEETGRVIAQYPTEAELALAREAERNAQRSG